MDNDDLISRKDLLERIEKERAYLKARGLYGAEEILTKYLRNIVEDMPPGEIEFPIIKINVSKEEIQKLLEELRKPHKVLVLPEPEVESIRLYGEWIQVKGEDGIPIYRKFLCSRCNEVSVEQYSFCPNCGVKMRGKVK